MTAKQSKFVSSAKTSTLASLSAVYMPLLEAVAEADAAITNQRETYNQLLNPRSGGRRSEGERTRDNNSRKYAHVAAVHRERAAFERLCLAMDAMHPLLNSTREKLKTLTGEDPEFVHVSLLRLNFVEACRLYRAAFYSLSRFSEMDYEWTLDAFLDEETKAAAEWLSAVPAVPPRAENHRAHQPAVLLGRAVTGLVEKNGFGGGSDCFLGTVMYASDITPSEGAVSFSIFSEEESAAYAVSRLLRDAGHKASVNHACGTALEVRYGDKQGRRKTDK